MTRQDKPLDPWSSKAPRAPGRTEPKQISVDSTRPDARMRALVEKSGSQAITTGAGFTAVTFSVTLFDTAGLYTASRFTIPTVGKVTGPWLIFGQVTWAGDSAGTRRQLRLLKNGSTALRTVVMQPVANGQSQAVMYVVNDPGPPDYYELTVSHDAGHDVNVLADSQFGIVHEW